MTGVPREDPHTLGQWREAMVLACLWLEVRDAQLLGMVKGPKVNVARCEELLARGRAIAGLEHWPSYEAVALARDRLGREGGLGG